MTDRAATGAARRTYRHGDLRHALLQAGIELARAGGPSAVVLREATRRAGVVPNAAYRHFASREALLQAVRATALAALAAAMQAELAALAPGGPPADQARARLRAVGAGYLRFARQETGLFRTAFAAVDPPGAELAEPASHGSPDPFDLLGAALDGLVATGLLSADRRPGAEHLAWSAVHGFATLTIDGPLRRLPDAQLARLSERLLGMVEQGL